MPEKKPTKKSFATLAADLRRIRNRKPTAKQIEELNSVLEEPKKKPRDTTRKKVARSPETEV